MGLFGPSDDDIVLENADLDCKPQNDFVSKKEVKPVDDKLSPGEQVHYLFTGGSGLEIDGEKDDRVGSSRTAITDQRILIKVKKSLVGTEYHSIRYSDITGVSLSEGAIIVAMLVDTTSKQYKVWFTQASGGSSEVGYEAIEFVRRKADQDVQNVNMASGNEKAKDPFSKLEKLKSLNENDIISEEEFNAKKQELLDEI